MVSNTPPVLTGATIALSEGELVTLDSANFGINDPDSSSFTITVSALTGGYFQLSSQAGVAISAFTSTDLSAHRVQFVDDGNELAPGFSVTVNDGTSDSNVLATSVSYTPAHDGDINGNGVVNVVDIMLAEQIALGLLTPTTDQFAHGDVAPLVSGIPAPDVKIDAADLLIITRKALGLVNF